MVAGKERECLSNTRILKEESIMKRCIVAATVFSLFLGVCALAQDDYDLDALLGEFDEPAAEEAVEPAAEAVADAAQEVADDFAEFAEEAAPAAVEVEEVAVVEEDPFAGMADEADLASIPEAAEVTF